jgi:branched-chain amino acid transport system permease protein
MRRSFSWAKVIFLVGLAVFLLWYPKLADPYFLHLAVAAFLAMILASSWDILARTGQVSVGQAGLFGIGAYTAALLYKWIHLSPVPGGSSQSS